MRRRPDAELRAALDDVRARADLVARREADPVGFVHRYADPLDQELVGLVAAGVAFGNVKTIRAKLADLLARVGESPRAAAEDPRALHRRLAGWKHRVFRGEDLARLLVGARAVQRAHGSLGARFADDLARAGGDVREALATFCEAVQRAPGGLAHARTTRRGPKHLLPDPRGPSGSKRLLLYLRWMVRPKDGVDLGLWPVDPSVLLVPVDTHIHKLANNLGLLGSGRRAPRMSWQTTRAITRALARLDPADPVKYDFSLCHLGMVQRCPSRKDAVRCEGCGVRPVCRHWLSR